MRITGHQLHVNSFIIYLVAFFVLTLCRATKAEAAKLQAISQHLAQLISTNTYLSSLPPSAFKNEAIRATEKSILSAIQGQGISVSPIRPDAPVGQSANAVPAPLPAAAPPEDEICSICLSPVTMQHTSTRTPCRHIFHHNCLATWLNSNSHNPTCPSCRTSLRSNFIEQVENFGNHFQERDIFHED